MEEPLKEPLVLTIFGITGDLAQRYILPALYQLVKAGELPEDLSIIGVSRRDVAVDEVFAELGSYVGEGFDDTIKAHLLRVTEMRKMDLDAEADYRELLTYLQDKERQFGGEVNRLYYLSIPAQSFAPIVRLLGATGHNTMSEGMSTLPRLLIEKPFGYDLASAEELISAVQEHFSEAQAYRIDHYLAKETAQNILTFRFRNPLFEAVWNNKYIESVSVIAREKLDIENRTNFYEQTGALRDLIQSHLLQIMAITTMDKPDQLESAAIHARRLELLEAVQPISDEDVTQTTVRGQYEGYRKEVDNPESLIETYAKLRLQINNERWRGIPITLETGKALTERRTEVVICFKQLDGAEVPRNRIIFRIKPNEGITLQVQAKRPGIIDIMQPVDMDFDYDNSFNERQPEAYERVIVDAIRGDQTLFASSEEVLTSWRIIENVLKNWASTKEGLEIYPKGSDGPLSQ